MSVRDADSKGYRTSGLHRVVPGILAVIAFAVVTLPLLLLSAGPLVIGDAWWHLALGEYFIASGPWLESDPLLFENASGRPDPHAWLFGSLLAGLHWGAGLEALRIFHVAMVASIIAGGVYLFRRNGGPLPLALLGTGAFLLLAEDRLLRLRPDLFSIAAILALTALLFTEKKPPSALRVVAAGFVLLLWANTHALFGVGILLLAAACAAIIFAGLLEPKLQTIPPPKRTSGESGANGSRILEWLKPMTAALILGLVAAVLSPRGFQQHLAFFRGSSESPLWAIGDDWAPFRPFLESGPSLMMGSETWAIAVAVLMGFVASALWALWRFGRAPSTARLRDFDAVLAALSLAALAASFVSQRFLWLYIFPLLYVHRALLAASRHRTRNTLAWLASLLALLMGFWATQPSDFPANIKQFTAMLQKSLQRGAPRGSVNFIAASDLSGNLLGRYTLGGFTGYWLAPQIRSLVNGSMNFPYDAWQDYTAVMFGNGLQQEESFLPILERREIDLFVGVGIPDTAPPGPNRFYTTTLLEGKPGWLLIYRGLDEAVYLNANRVDPSNLESVIAYYEDEGLPFDPASGLDMGTLLRRHTDWAISESILPVDYPKWLKQSQGPFGNERAAALFSLAETHLLLGDYAGAVAYDLELLRERPNLEAARRRVVFSLLRLGRGNDALLEARQLPGLRRRDPVSQSFLDAAGMKARWEADPSAWPPGKVETLDRMIAALPVVPRQSAAARIFSRVPPHPRPQKSNLEKPPG